MSEHTVQGSGQGPGVEPDLPKASRIWMFISIVLFFLFLVHFCGYFWFLRMKDSELQAKQVYFPDRSLQLQHEKEAEALTKYHMLDKEKSVVQLPVTKAMELLVKEQSDPASETKKDSSKTGPLQKH